MKSLPSAVLFDHDGVLVHSENLHAKAWDLLFETMGLDFDVADIDWQHYAGKPAPVLIEEIFRKHSRNPKFHNFSLEERDALALKKNNFYFQLAQNGALEPVEGVFELLDFLKSRNIPCAVVSNAKQRELNFSLTTLKLTSYFTCVLSRDDVPSPKPHPSAYLTGAAKCGVPPTECLAIDDSPTGLISALRAGIPAWALSTTFPESALRAPVPGAPDLKVLEISRNLKEIYLRFSALENKS